MDIAANPVLVGVGLALLIAGWFLYRRGGRHSLADAVTDAAWDSVKARDMGALRKQVEGTLADVASDGSVTGGAKKLAGLAAREAYARFLKVAGGLSMLGGLVLAALGLFWR